MTDKNGESISARPALWLRILKWLGITVASLAVLFVVVCTLIVWILTPSRLTPLVERLANDNLNAEVSVGRVELTFWHSFPELTVDVHSLSVVSKAFSALPDSTRSTLPADADSLFSVARFHGGINLLPLAVGHIALYDLLITSPEVNIVQLSPECSNIDIFPSSEQSAREDTSISLPAISVSRFEITDASSLRYRSLPDSLDLGLSLKVFSLSGADAPEYQLSSSGNLMLPILSEFNLGEAPFRLQGSLDWNCHNPLALSMSNFCLTVDSLSLLFAGELDFSRLPVVNTFTAKVENMPVEALLAHMPRDMRSYTDPLSTSMTCSASLTLDAPYLLTDTLLPPCSASLLIPPCSVEYQQLKFSDVTLDLTARLRPHSPDSTVVDIRKFSMVGRSIDFNLAARISSPGPDMLVDGSFRGTLNFGFLPPRLLADIPATLSGMVQGDTGFRFRLSDFNRTNFHRINAEGSLKLDNFRAELPDSTGGMYVRSALLEFGSDNRFVAASGVKVDSLLTLSLKVDTLAASGLGMSLSLRNLKAGAGTLNRSFSADTSQINPFGMRFAVNRLSFASQADSMRVRLSDANISASLRRYKSEARVPQLNLDLSVARLGFGQALSRFAVSDAHANLDVHLRQRKLLPTDSASVARRMARRKALADSLAASSGVDVVSFDMDSTERSLLRRWDFNGSLRAASGRLVTPYFPLRNRFTNVDLAFSQDSVVLRNLACKAGGSDFLVNGSVTNLRRALVSRRNNTLGLNLSLVSDTINVNEIVRALFAGGALAKQSDSTMVWDEHSAVTDGRFEQMADSVGSGPLLIPHNISANLSLKSRRVLYSDLLLHDFTGNMELLNGAVRLSDLSASTDIGSMRVDALYSAPDSANIEFGVGMKVDRFRLDRLTSIVPAIDSLLPAMRNFGGLVDADVAVSTHVTPQMDIDIPSLRAVIKIEGDSLVLLDPDTFKTLSKWLFFRDKKHNVINHMAVEVVIENSTIELYPFMFDIDRYRLGVMGHNDLAMNLNYHVSVLKSPIPFKFGINIKGTPDDMKIRLGGAKVKQNMIGERQAIADNTRVNIVEQLDNLFRRGIAKAGRSAFSLPSGSRLDKDLLRNSALESSKALLNDFDSDALTPADSLRMIRQGLIPNPDPSRYPTGPLPTGPLLSD